MIGGLPSVDKIDVEEDEVDQKEGEDSEHYSDEPGEHTHEELPLLAQLGLNSGDDNMSYDCEGIGESGDYTYEEVLVIPLAHAVIEPHAVVVEEVDAAIASAAVLAIDPAVTIAVLAEQYLIVLRGEDDLLVELGPFVVVDHPVSRVDQRGCCRAAHHRSPADSVEDDEHQLIL